MSAEITSKNAATTKVINQVEPDRFLLHLRPVIKLTDDQLFELCQINQELWIERTAEGDLVIMAPEGWETGNRTITLVTLLTQWAWHDGTGVTTGSSAGYLLPNGAMRAPDVCLGVALTSGPLIPRTETKISTTLPRLRGGDPLAIGPPEHCPGENARIPRQWRTLGLACRCR